jgi:hypothetical protein
MITKVTKLQVSKKENSSLVKELKIEPKVVEKSKKIIPATVLLLPLVGFITNKEQATTRH